MRLMYHKFACLVSVQRRQPTAWPSLQSSSMNKEADIFTYGSLLNRVVARFISRKPSLMWPAVRPIKAFSDSAWCG